MLAGLLAESGVELVFNVVEVGAIPISKEVEPFHALLDFFPDSRISALEIDAKVCAKLNQRARPGLRFYPCALGRTEETRPLYETLHGMCTSLYRPDERYADVFNLLDVMRLKAVSTVETISLDTFVQRYAAGPLDFVKMDIQGAELDVLQGGASALRDVLMLVCEVEFTPLYVGQPLFGDVDAHLRKQGFMLHKFLGMGGRVMKPLAAHGTGNYPVQMMWSDALFTRDLLDVSVLDQEQKLKLAVLLDLYDSKDVALHLLRHYDAACGSDFASRYLNLVIASGEWHVKRPANP